MQVHFFAINKADVKLRNYALDAERTASHLMVCIF